MRTKTKSVQFWRVLSIIMLISESSMQIKCARIYGVKGKIICYDNYPDWEYVFWDNDKLNHYGLKIHRLGSEWNSQKFRLKPIEKTKTESSLKLFQNEILVTIRGIFVMIQVLAQKFIGNITNSPTTIANTPKMTAPITTTKFRVFLNKHTRIRPLRRFTISLMLN